MNREATIFHIPSPKLALLYPSSSSRTSETPENTYKITEIPSKITEIPSKVTETPSKLNEITSKITEGQAEAETSSLLPISTYYKTSIRPFLSPDKKKLAFFGSPLKPAHVNGLSLLVIDLEKMGDVTGIPQKLTEICVVLTEIEKRPTVTEIKGLLTETRKIVREIERKVYRILQNNMNNPDAMLLVNQLAPKLSKVLAKLTEIKPNLTDISSHFSEIKAVLSEVKADLAHIPAKANEIGHLEEVIVPIIEENVFLRFTREEIKQRNDRSVFAGIFGFFDVIDTAGWMEDSRHIVISSIVGAELAVFVVDSVTKEISKMTPPTSLSTSYWRLLSRGPFSDSLVFSFENSKNSILPKIAIVSNLREAIMKRTGELREALAHICGDVNEICEGLTGCEKGNWQASKAIIWELHRISSPCSEFSQKLERLFSAKFVEKRITGGTAEGFLWKLEGYTADEFSAFFPSLLPPSSSPLLLHLHGGPHGNFTGTSKLRLILLLRGFQLLLPNFSGSCGYGQNHLESLLPPTTLPPPSSHPPPSSILPPSSLLPPSSSSSLLQPRIGRRDFDEVMEMVESVVGKEEKFWVCGGSYGGYLGAVMAGREKRVKGAILMNPVIDIPFMINVTDIPDWCSAETLGLKFRFNYSKSISSLLFLFFFSSSSLLLLVLPPPSSLLPPSFFLLPHPSFLFPPPSSLLHTLLKNFIRSS